MTLAQGSADATKGSWDQSARSAHVYQNASNSKVCVMSPPRSASVEVAILDALVKRRNVEILPVSNFLYSVGQIVVERSEASVTLQLGFVSVLARTTARSARCSIAQSMASTVLDKNVPAMASAT